MTKLPKGLQVIIASISVVLAISALFVAARWLLRFLFKGVNPTVAAAIVAAVATGIASLLAVLLQRRYEERQQHAIASRDRKVKLYENFVTSWFQVFGVGEVRTPEEAQVATTSALAAMTKMIPEMIFWASDASLVEWSRLRRVTVTAGPEQQQFNLLGFEKVLLAIRQDLGHKNKGIEAGDLLGLWVNDIDAFIKAHPEDKNR
jgi:hypothetical protein